MDVINFTSCHICFHPITVLASNPQELIVGDLETYFFCGKVAPFGSRGPAPLKTNLKTIQQALGTQNHPVAADDAIPKFHWAVSW